MNSINEYVFSALMEMDGDARKIRTNGL